MMQTGTTNSDAQHREIDRILATEDALVPSSGFLASVMERVREEAAAPAPIPFPWKRALPGMVVLAIMLCVGTLEFVRQGLPAASEFTLTTPQIPVALEKPLEQVGWVALALGASLISWLLSKRLTGRAGLL
jgi:hypothetical protein